VNEFGLVASASIRTMPAPLDHNEEDEIEDPEHVLSYPVRTDDSVYYPPYEQFPIRGPWKVEPETMYVYHLFTFFCKTHYAQAPDYGTASFTPIAMLSIP
jgi:hypothetical protein